MKRALVVGAGLSGLTTAWHLEQCGFAVTVRERSSHAGGLIQTKSTEHGPVETAANAFVWTPTVEAWFQRLDLTPAFPRPESRRRYVFRNNSPRRWPLSIRESSAMAGRLAFTAVTRGFPPREKETVAAWGDRVVGHAAREWLLDPAMQGIYGTPAVELSASAIFRRRRRRTKLAAPVDGMGRFVSQLYERLAHRGVRFEFGSEATELERDVPTAICTDAAGAACLLERVAPAAAMALARVRLTALATITAFFATDPRDVRGFGVLFPRRSGVHALGVLFNADIFAHRGGLRSETWIVGNHDGAVTAWSDSQLIASLLADRQRMTGRSSEPASVHITRWPRAIPVYDETILQAEPALQSLPQWLAVAGNYLGRIGVADLLEAGERAAARLCEHASHRSGAAAAD